MPPPRELIRRRRGTRRSSSLSALALGASLIALAPLAASAQVEARGAGCELDLTRANDDYALGRFEQVVAALEPCLGARLSRLERGEVNRLLALTYLAMDELPSAEQTVGRLLLLNPGFEPLATDPQRFRDLVARVRGQSTGVTISSVSKTAESLREAPATVIVVTAEEISRRGYLNLEEILHDLPGFDISRGNGGRYSSFYPRGYRNDSNDRTLFLIDGVEESDLWSNAVYLSRQYPVSNIDRVEFVYGPASTMYGPNAFLGVINVITKSPESLIEEGKSWGARAQVGVGRRSTRNLDATVAGRRGASISWSLAVRGYASDGRDRSGFTDWDYDLGFYDRFDYQGRRGIPAELVPLARASDQAAFAELNGGNPIRYVNHADDWSVYAKVQIFDLTLGIQKWRREEGSNGWYVDTARSTSRLGNVWAPEHTFLYLKYGKKLTPQLSFELLSQYLDHEVTPGSGNTQITSYQRGRLNAQDLVSEVPAYWVNTLLSQSSSQLRTEARFAWARSERFSLISGVEVRNGALQGDYRQSTTAVTGGAVAAAHLEDNGRLAQRPEVLDQFDVGVFTQATIKPAERWKIVAGGRWDRNEVDLRTGERIVAGGKEFDPEGYGSVFNPRLAVVYTTGPWTAKAVYASAFKDASNFNRYATNPGTRDLPNPGLEPEKVDNVELAIAWQPSEELSLDLALYAARYSDAVQQREVDFDDADGKTIQNASGGRRDVEGLQATLRWKRGRYDLYANLTVTEPEERAGADLEGGEAGSAEADRRVPDIADYRLNVGVHARLRDRLGLDLRANYVSDRFTGDRVTAEGARFREVDAYLVLHGALTYDEVLPGLSLQLQVRNLLDESYYHPGVRTATGSFASRLPQDDRSFFVRAEYAF